MQDKKIRIKYNNDEQIIPMRFEDSLDKLIAKFTNYLLLPKDNDYSFGEIIEKKEIIISKEEYKTLKNQNLQFRQFFLKNKTETETETETETSIPNGSKINSINLNERLVESNYNEIMKYLNTEISNHTLKIKSIFNSESSFIQELMKNNENDQRKSIKEMINQLFRTPFRSLTSNYLEEKQYIYIKCNECKQTIQGNRFLSQDNKCFLCEKCFEETNPNEIYYIIREPIKIKKEDPAYSSMLENLFQDFSKKHPNFCNYPKNTIIKALDTANGFYPLTQKLLEEKLV